MWFARVWLHALACRDCGYSELEAFSCKRRRLCISPRTSHGPIRLCVLKRVCCLAFSQVECPAHSDHDTKDLEEPEATFDALEQFVDATLEHVESADAKVIDYVPPSRTTAGWLIRRMRTVGRCVAPLRRDIDGPFRATVATLAKSPVWILIGVTTTIAGSVGGGKAWRVRGRSWIAYGIGLSEGVLSSSRAGRPSSTSD